MYNNDLRIKEKIEGYKNQIDNIRNDFRQNLKPRLTELSQKQLIKDLLCTIQYDIDDFLIKNDIKISIYVSILDHQLIIIGSTLFDQIIWEIIQ